ncbi:hypothetical protein IMW75_20010 [Pseudomonas gregormendelii]|uniref:Lipoprotein n=1 Tax=Pseudomonas gregormendelii TaxID=1628277 RepID=A0ABS3AKV6_9PSED|nr:hypothetical protein [Pseudomonas gregormendelii]MBN3967548.1 hypothetical protein [Pseudomonas gregormendelii]
MKKHIAVLAVSSLALAGCDNYKSDFQKALSQDLETTGSLCLGIKKWPIDVTVLEFKSKSLRAMTFAGLTIDGLVNVEETSIGTSSWRMPVSRYTPSEKAKPFMIGPDICWGRKELTEVVKWDGPMSNGDYKEAVVSYKYNVQPMTWIITSALPLYYPEMLQVNAGPQQARATLKLSSAGWEVK